MNFLNNARHVDVVYSLLKLLSNSLQKLLLWTCSFLDSLVFALLFWCGMLRLPRGYFGSLTTRDKTYNGGLVRLEALQRSQGSDDSGSHQNPPVGAYSTFPCLQSR